MSLISPISFFKLASLWRYIPWFLSSRLSFSSAISFLTFDSCSWIWLRVSFLLSRSLFKFYSSFASSVICRCLIEWTFCSNLALSNWISESSSSIDTFCLLCTDVCSLRDLISSSTRSVAPSDRLACFYSCCRLSRFYWKSASMLAFSAKSF